MYGTGWMIWEIRKLEYHYIIWGGGGLSTKWKNYMYMIWQRK